MVYHQTDTRCAEEGEPSTASGSHLIEQLSPASLLQNPMRCEMGLPFLAAHCLWELDTYRQGEPGTDAYGLELLRRAIIRSDQVRTGGAWQVITTPEGPGAPPPLPVLIVFAAGGGLVDSGRPPGTPGFGAWVSRGENIFALTFLALRFDPQGHFAGTTKVRAQANLSEDGNTYTGPGFTEMFDATGKLLASFKSTAQATRITVEPL